MAALLNRRPDQRDQNLIGKGAGSWILRTGGGTLIRIKTLIMNLITRPSTSLPTLSADWMSPSRLFDREFFDMDPEQFPARVGITIPSVNLAETHEAFLIELAVPGLDRQDFTIELENHLLTIGAKKLQDETNESQYYKKEYSFTSFSRSFSLPENVTEEAINAKYENGILKVTVPKVTETQTTITKKITVS
jgi:HSP20 family protein